MASKKPPIEFRESEIEFLAEQDGIPERELKSELRNCFQCSAAVLRAYLAVVRYSGKPDHLVALCLVARPNSESEFVSRISEVFSKMFSSRQHLDIMLIDEAQEMNLSKVCRPFFCQSFGRASVGDNPDFYLVSSEGYGLESPRKCWCLRPLELMTRDDILLVKIDPPIIYRNPIAGELVIKQVVLAARHKGYSINSIQEWPFYVHVARLKRPDVPADGRLNSEDVETIAWAELYPSQAAADAEILS